MTRRTRFTTAITMSALLLAACGGSDDDAAGVDQGSESAPQDSAEVTEEEAPAPSSTCAPTAGTFETSDGSTTAELAHAVAARIEGGAAYTVYLAERQLGVDELGIVSTPSGEAGAPVVALAITTFNAETTPPAITAGESVAFTPDFGVRTFRVTADLGDDFLGDNADATGTVTVTEVDGNFCGEVTYSDGEKSLTATFDAPTKDV